MLRALPLKQQPPFYQGLTLLSRHCRSENYECTRQAPHLEAPAPEMKTSTHTYTHTIDTSLPRPDSDPTSTAGSYNNSLLSKTCTFSFRSQFQCAWMHARTQTYCFRLYLRAQASSLRNSRLHLSRRWAAWYSHESPHACFQHNYSYAGNDRACKRETGPTCWVVSNVLIEEQPQRSQLSLPCTG